MRLVSSAFTEEQGGGLSDVFRLHSLSGAAPRHKLGASSPWHPSLFSICPKAKLFYQTLPKWLWPPPLFLLLEALAVLVYSAVPLPGRKESLSPQRLFNTRASFNFFQLNKYLLSICSVPHFAQESTALGPTVIRKEEMCYRLNVCVPPKFIYWSCNPQCDGIWRSSLRFRWGHDGITAFIRRGALCLLECTKKRSGEHPVRRQPSPSQKGSPHQNYICWHPGLKLPSSLNCEK